MHETLFLSLEVSETRFLPPSQKTQWRGVRGVVQLPGRAGERALALDAQEARVAYVHRAVRVREPLHRQLVQPA